MVVGFIGIEFQDSGHPNFHQLQYIFAGNFPFQFWLPWQQAQIDMINCLIHIGRIFECFIFIDPFLDEYFFERRIMPCFFKFTTFNFKFKLQQGNGLISIDPEDFADSNKLRFIIFNDTTVGRNRNFAIGKGKQGINGFIGRHSRNQMDHDFNLIRSIIVNFLDFYFAFIIGFNDRFNKRSCSSSERHFGNNQCFTILFLNRSPDFN